MMMSRVFVSVLLCVALVVAQNSQELTIGDTRLIIQASPAQGNGSAAVPADARRIRLGLDVADCTDGCDADENSSGPLAGPIVDSEGLGSLDESMVRASKGRAKVVKNACGCPVCPCATDSVTPRVPISSSLSSSNQGGDLPTTVVRVNLDGTLADEPLDLLPANCGCSGCPACSKAPYLPPDERKFLARMIMAKRTREEREKQRRILLSEVEDYESTLSEIGKLQRALQFQYAELRRKHQNLRTEAAANKVAITNMGGDDDLKGTDFDIEGPIPATVEDVDKIIASAVANPKRSSNMEVAAAAEILETLKRAVNKNEKDKCRIVRKALARTKKTVREFLGANQLPVSEAEQIINNLKTCDTEKTVDESLKQSKDATLRDKKKIADEATKDTGAQQESQMMKNMDDVLKAAPRF